MNNLIDIENIKKTIGSDPNLIKKIITLYLRDAPKLLAEIGEALKIDDNKKLADSAHALKGVTSYYSTDIAHNLCLKLEQLGKENSMPGKNEEIKNLLSQLDDGIALLIEELKIYIEQI